MAKSPERWAERQTIILTRPIPAYPELVAQCQEYRQSRLFRVKKNALLNLLRHEYTNYDRLWKQLETKFRHRPTHERNAAVQILRKKAINLTFSQLKKLEGRVLSNGIRHEEARNN